MPCSGQPWSFYHAAPLRRRRPRGCLRLGVMRNMLTVEPDRIRLPIAHPPTPQSTGTSHLGSANTAAPSRLQQLVVDGVDRGRS